MLPLPNTIFDSLHTQPRLVSATGGLKHALRAPRDAQWSSCRRWLALIYTDEVHLLSLEHDAAEGAAGGRDAGGGAPLRLRWASTVALRGVASAKWHGGGLPLLALATARALSVVVVRARADATVAAAGADGMSAQQPTDSITRPAAEWPAALAPQQLALNGSGVKNPRGARAQERPFVAHVASYDVGGANYALLELVRETLCTVTCISCESATHNWNGLLGSFPRTHLC